MRRAGQVSAATRGHFEHSATRHLHGRQRCASRPCAYPSDAGGAQAGAAAAATRTAVRMRAPVYPVQCTPLHGLRRAGTSAGLSPARLAGPELDKRRVCGAAAGATAPALSSVIGMRVSRGAAGAGLAQECAGADVSRACEGTSSGRQPAYRLECQTGAERAARGCSMWFHPIKKTKRTHAESHASMCARTRARAVSRPRSLASLLPPPSKTPTRARPGGGGGPRAAMLKPELAVPARPAAGPTCSSESPSRIAAALKNEF